MQEETDEIVLRNSWTQPILKNCLGPIVRKPLKGITGITFLKNFCINCLGVRTVKNFESKLDQKPHLHWRLAFPGVDRVPGK